MNTRKRKVTITVIPECTMEANLGMPPCHTNTNESNNFTKDDAPLEHEITKRHLGP